MGAKEAPKEVAGCDVQALGAAPQQRADRGRSERRVPEHGGSHLHGKACDGASWKRIPAFRRQEVLSPWASRREVVRDAAHQVGPCAMIARVRAILCRVIPQRFLVEKSQATSGR